MEYLPIDGLKSFVDNSLKLAYTKSCKQLNDGKIVGVQALSGTGALRIGFEFLGQHYPGERTVYIPDPTWQNHGNVIKRAGGLKVKNYRYYDFDNKKFDLNGMLEDIDRAPDGSIVLLHPSAHNPTGCDPNKSEWEEIYRVVQKKSHFPFFDMAYQGFASGDVDKDSYSLRRFVEGGMKVALAQSFAKNFGLYGQRIGCFSVITDSKSETDAVSSNIKFLARAQYSNPPKHGAHIVDIILSDPDLTKEWYKELKIMSGRIISIRRALYDNLKRIGSQENWDHIISQIGMFAYTGLTAEQSQTLRSKHKIYLYDDGRISISGLNTKNVEEVAQSFHEVTSKIHAKA